MIADIFGLRPGSEVDHTLQNLSNISRRLRYSKPKLANSINLNPELTRNSLACVQAMNEIDLGRVGLMFKYIETPKMQYNELQPLGFFFRICALMTNLITMLDCNGTNEYIDCQNLPHLNNILTR